MAAAQLGLDNHAYRAGVLYAAGGAAASAMRRAIAAIERAEPAAARDMLQFELALLSATLDAVDTADAAIAARHTRRRNNAA